MNHEKFEKKLMDMFLDGNEPVLEELRDQYKNSIVESRKFTGAGFFTHFKVDKGISPLAGRKSFQISDIDVTSDSVKGAFGFILFINEGYLSMLEGYTLSTEVWPEDYSNIVLSYFGSGGARDLEKLKKRWA